MNLDGLYTILKETTQTFRKGDVVVEEEKPGLKVTHVYGYPHTDEAEGLEMVDCHFIVVGVDKAKAEKNADALAEILAGYPQPDRLAGGPSYIEVGAEIGDQGAAFELFALGKVLGWWSVITPEAMGIEGEAADDLAGRGFVMMSGWRGGREGR